MKYLYLIKFLISLFILVFFFGGGGSFGNFVET